jgi:glyoxylase-like metal-dependent hydrolase (beta-lactamase superfamily II)
MSLLQKWAKKKNRAAPSIIVIHSHGHGDHTAGDKQFQALAGVEFIAATPADVQKAAGIPIWPSGLGQIDLGSRILDVIPVPGHHAASIALYDRRTGNLLTGDTLYPGRLYVNLADVPTYAASAQRLAEFVRRRPVAHVLGAHIEQSRTPYVDYPRGAPYQPEEHALELSRSHVLELNDAFQQMQGQPTPVALPDFTISVRPAAQR